MKKYRLREYLVEFKDKETGEYYSVSCKAYTAKQAYCVAWRNVFSGTQHIATYSLPQKVVWTDRPIKNK